MGDMIFIFDDGPIVIPFVFADALGLEMNAESEQIEGVVAL